MGNVGLIQCYVPPRQTHVPADWAIVLYDKGQQSETDYVMLSWRPVTVSVTVSDDLPAPNAGVTLTAKADAPSDATYRWEERSAGGSWSALTGSAATKDVSLTRGTRPYRVTVSHTTATSATAEAIYVTWDALDIWGDLSTALTTAVTGHSDYTSKQTALLTCMNAGVAVDDQYGSFDDILADYANAKAKLEGACSSQSSEMFSTSQRVVQAKLNALRNGNTDYDEILGTPQGERFKAIAGNAAEIKRLLNLATGVATPGSIEFPVYEEVQANEAVQARSPSPSQTLTQDDLRQGTGLDCLPSRVRGEDLTLDNKLRVLNCLVFDTPHSFWLDVSALKREARPGGRFAWLLHNTGIDWRFSAPLREAQGPVVSCLKHDVAYAGLQVITGTDAPRADSYTLDEAWNPRNKALADCKFKADITAYGCQNEAHDALLLCLLSPNQVMAGVFFFFVAEINHKNWPVTPADIRHFKANEEFTVCAEPVVPKVELANVVKAGYSLNATWSGAIDRAALP